MPTTHGQEFIIGQAASWTAQLLDSNGNAITSYAGSEPLTARLWTGGSTPTILNPSAAWSSPSTGTISIGLTSAQTSTLAVGWYRVEVDITLGAASYPAVLFDAEGKPSAGSTPLGAVYCAYADMLKYAGDWLPRLGSKLGETSFADQRSRARSWLDDIIIARARPGTLMWTPATSGLEAFFEPDAPNPFVRQWLAQNFLIIRDITLEITARKAISIACELGAGIGDSGGQYDALGARYGSQAEQLVRSYRAEIDLNGDGMPDQAWHLGVMSWRLI
ncbi:MAG: hypothetical protein KGM43_06360 [Planctomycetota bacterium]|nr:hypothetical protein [Planctomycetota bacterium]